MKILVTGTGTLLGNTIIRSLQKKNFELIGTYRSSYPKLFKHNKVKIIKHDLNNSLKITDKFDVLIHCASGIPSDLLTRQQMIKVNFYGFKKLLELAIKNRCKKVILFSTMSVYGKVKAKTLNETTPSGKLDSYGLSKLKMENYLKNIAKKSKLSYAIFRIPAILGVKSKNNFLSNLIIKIKKNEKVFLTNPNLMFNNAIHVKNIFQIVLKSIKKKREKNTYNLASRNKMKLIKIIKLIYKIMKKKEQFIFTKSDKKGFNININRGLKNKYIFYSIKKTITLFSKDNL